MNPSISKFIAENEVATLCCTDSSGIPYCFNCYYAVDVKQMHLYFKSSKKTKHSLLMQTYPNVAGTILSLKTQVVGPRLGLQLNGQVIERESSCGTGGSDLYYQHYPDALGIPGDIWVIQINTIKLSNTSPVFGEKLHWERHERSDTSSPIVL